MAADSDRHAFDELVRVTVTIGSVDKWLPMIGDDPGLDDVLKVE